MEPLTEAETEALRTFPYEEDALKRRVGFERFVMDVSGEALKRRMYSEPSLSICGIEAGELYHGPRGIVPHRAGARISFYLVANQDPDKIAGQLRAHLDKKGFADVQISRLGSSYPVKTPLDIPFRDQICRSAAMVYDKPMVIEPTMLGSGPAIVFRRSWDRLPIVGIGPGNTGSNHHAPDENLAVEDYKNAVKHIIALLYTMGEAERT